MQPGGAQQPLAQAPGEPEPGNRIATVPNALSALRLAGVPFFLWLALGPRTTAADAWAVVLLFTAGATDWLDGKIARALNQQSRLGELLDPAADRLYITATLIALAIRGIIPWWLVAVLVARELVLAGSLLRLRSAGYGPLQVSFAGKAATMCLFYAFPLLLLGAHHGTGAEIARIIGWAMAIWGTALYWIAAGLYLIQASRLLAQVRAGPVGPTPPA